MLHKQTTQIRYQYDALDRLTRHCRQGSVDRQRFYCESRLVSEIGGGEQVSIVQHGDHLLAQQRRDSDGLDNTLLAMDQQRSVLNTLLVNHQRPIAYSPYGYHHCESGLTSLPRFNGQRTESVTGHYLLGNGYRAFNPLLMRFNSPDKLSPFGEGGLNTYSYCQGDPVNRVDPSGGVGSFVNSGGRRMFVSHKEVSVTWFGESGRLIKDTYHGMPRLTIKGHGGRIGYYHSGKFSIDSPLSLKHRVEKLGVKFEDYKNIRLVMCFSADVPSFISPRSVSFAQEFSDVTGLPVKAYSGIVWSLDLPMSSGYVDVPARFGVLKEGKPYIPEYFQPRGKDNNVASASEIRNPVKKA